MPFQVIESWKTYFYSRLCGWMDRDAKCLDYNRGVPYVDGSKQGLGRTLWSCILFKDLYNKKQ